MKPEEKAADDYFKTIPFEHVENVSFKDVSRNSFLSGVRWQEERGKVLVEAVKKENPEWNTCTHDFEPNTTMDYFRCDKCGIRTQTFEALKIYEEGK